MMTNRTDPKTRKPWVAALLSLILPGLGHLYSGRPASALVAYLAAMASAVIAMMLLARGPVVFNLLYPLIAGLAIYLGIAVHAALTAREAPKSYVPTAYNRWYVYLGVYVLLGLGAQEGLLAIGHSYRGEAFRIPTGAMEPTLLIGDFIFVIDDFDYIEQDGMFVMWSEDDALSFIKRVVGLPEDTLSMVDGTLMRNGEVLDEYVYRDRNQDSYIPADILRAWQLPHLVGAAAVDYRPDMANWGPLVVPPDSVFVLGDNLGNSHDSRARGFMPLASIWGQPTTIYFSYDPFSEKSFPFLTAIRWERIGRRLDQPGIR